jgi:hypothetical protein
MAAADRSTALNEAGGTDALQRGGVRGDRARRELVGGDRSIGKTSPP